MDTTVLVSALTGMIGLAVGAGLQYYTARSLQRGSHFTALRSRAYVDFVKAVAAIAVGGRDPLDSSSAAGALVDLTDAKTRIALYGSDSVLKALAAFSRTDERLEEEVATDAFIALAIAMRQDATGKAVGAEMKPALSAILLKQ